MTDAAQAVMSILNALGWASNQLAKLVALAHLNPVQSKIVLALIYAAAAYVIVTFTSHFAETSKKVTAVIIAALLVLLLVGLIYTAGYPPELLALLNATGVPK